MTDLVVLRLGQDDLAAARDTFTLMAEVFEEEVDATHPLTDEYVDRILGDDSFWVLAAFAGPEVVGGITAHALPMTRSATSELFIYDLAVREDHQRTGVGRQLIRKLRDLADAAGLRDMFVPADNEDTHALDFYRAQGASEAPVTIFTFPAGDHA